MLFILVGIGDEAKGELAGKSRDPVDCIACTLYVRVLGMSEYWTSMIDTEVVSRFFESLDNLSSKFHGKTCRSN